jgi:hypothetical protein
MLNSDESIIVIKQTNQMKLASGGIVFALSIIKRNL